MRGRGVLGESGDDSGVGEEIARIGTLERAGLDVENVNEDTDVAEGLGFLRCEVSLCKGVLSEALSYISPKSSLQVENQEKM